MRKLKEFKWRVAYSWAMMKHYGFMTMPLSICEMASESALRDYGVMYDPNVAFQSDLGLR